LQNLGFAVPVNSERLLIIRFKARIEKLLHQHQHQQQQLTDNFRAKPEGLNRAVGTIEPCRWHYFLQKLCFAPSKIMLRAFGNYASRQAAPW